MAIPILKTWKRYFHENDDEGLGSSYERILVNRMLRNIVVKSGISNVLEVPSFGFTGISGINSMGLAREGVEVTLIDDCKERIDLIRKVWDRTGLSADIVFSQDFNTLPFPDGSFDLSWNYAALWFVEDLYRFITELDRITKKVIVFFVPNRTGLGYLSQKYFSGVEFVKYLNENAIIPKNIIRSMNRKGWTLQKRGFIDNPPWPDIGMSKQEFLALFGIGAGMRSEDKSGPRNCILDYYSGKAPHFEKRMLKYTWFEKISPCFIKFFWSHHKYLVFNKS